MAKKAWASFMRRARRPRPRSARKASAVAILAATACAVSTTLASAQESPPLPAPLDPTTVVRLARERRAEVAAARARALAAAERPRIVSALPDPMVMVSLDHLPIPVTGFDGSVSVQQEFPLSGVLGDRRRVAEADAERWKADTQRVALDVELEALQAYFMLAERRAGAAILDEQIAITDQLLTLTRAHFAAGQGMQSDVLRLDNEAARLRADRRALDAEVRGAEAMLNTALARAPADPIPELAWYDDEREPPPLDVLARKGLARRPELAAARSERTRAQAEVDVMQSMYGPMAFVRAGPAYTMLEGAGIMAMVGVSVPIWRGRLSAGVNEARSMVTMATAEISAMQRMIVGNIAEARERVLAERTRLLAIRQDILPRARQVVASAMGSFGAGQGSMLAVLDAARDLREIRMQELIARERLSSAWAKLRREMGD